MIDARSAGLSPRVAHCGAPCRARASARLSFATTLWLAATWAGGLAACTKHGADAVTTTPETTASGTPQAAPGDLTAAPSPRDGADDAEPTTPSEGGAAVAPPPAPTRLIEADFAAARAKVCDVEWDKPADYLYGVNDNRDEQHYVAGNEKALYAFEPHVRELGGAYVGVGSDQGYVFVGWMQPELAVFVDYDREVVEVHAVHQALIRAARDPEHLVYLWSADGREEAKAALESAFLDAELAVKRWRTYSKHRWVIHRRMSTMRKRHVALGVKTFVSDADTLGRIKAMLEEGRICVIQGNLLEKGAIQRLGAALSEVGLTVRGMYLSNAEEYWSYSKTFRENLHSLPFDDRALVLRTIVTWEYNNDYRYNVQAASNYLSWLGQPWVRRVYQITPKRKLKEPVEKIDLIVTDRAPTRDPVEDWDY
jgi:hypothetical protein